MCIHKVTRHGKDKTKLAAGSRRKNATSALSVLYTFGHALVLRPVANDYVAANALLRPSALSMPPVPEIPVLKLGFNLGLIRVVEKAQNDFHLKPHRQTRGV